MYESKYAQDECSTIYNSILLLCNPNHFTDNIISLYVYTGYKKGNISKCCIRKPELVVFTHLVVKHYVNYTYTHKKPSIIMILTM